MKRPELIEAFRDAVDDATQPYLWNPNEVDRYLNAAVREAAWRARLIYDTLTVQDTATPPVPVCSIAVLADTASYAAHPAIFEIDRARLNSRPTREWLTISSTHEIERDEPGWRSLTGIPRWLLVDHEADHFRLTLVPTPTEADTLWIGVYRLPLEEMNSAEDTPEIPTRYHYQLIDYMAFLAYQKPDVETRDEKKSVEAHTRFSMHFGPPRDANQQRYQQERRKAAVKFRSF
jgi:hypothetical protein